jgi:translation initiation factor 1
MSRLFAGTPLELPPTCERCTKPIGACTCPRDVQGKVVHPPDHAPRVQREKRGGKAVTVISNLPLREKDLKDFLKPLKSKLGTGGSISSDTKGTPTIELQGDHADAMVQYLCLMGYKAKRSGG